ncbi:hypothetical protein [Helicobacter sp. 23-1045]
MPRKCYAFSRNDKKTQGRFCDFRVRFCDLQNLATKFTAILLKFPFDFHKKGALWSDGRAFARVLVAGKLSL